MTVTPSSPEPSSASNVTPPRKPRPGERIEVDVVRYDVRGRPHGVSGPWEVVLDRGVPGARVAAEARRRRGGRIEARTREVLAPSPHAVEPRCRHVHACGGCSFQDLDYPRQLSELQRHVVEAFARAGLEPHVESVVACADPWRYRNKMDFTFGNRRWIEEHEPQGVVADRALGLHARGNFEKVIDVQRCLIQFEEGDGILASVRELAREQELELWDVRAHTGLLRHLVLRKGFRTGDLMVNLVTSREDPERVGALVEALLAQHPEITTVVHSVNTRPAAIAVGEVEHVLYGPGTIREELCGLAFTLSAGAFFQTNTVQAERLLDLVREAAAVGAADVVFDLYCGAGTIGLVLAPTARTVWGFEQVADAVRNAEENARRNGIGNARFVAGDVLAEIEPGHLASTGRPRPDVVVLDPPRAGLHPDVVPRVLALRPRRIVYVSCNAATATPDLARFVEGGYRMGAVTPVDLFPHTPHVEIVVALERIA